MTRILESICASLAVLTLSASLMINSHIRIKTLCREQEMSELMHTKSQILYYVNESAFGKISEDYLAEIFPDLFFKVSYPYPGITRITFSWNQSKKGTTYYVDVAEN